MLEQIKELYPLPFKFLDSYTKEDKNIFFGREQETEMLFEKVSEHRMTLIYGASGTGKTSLVSCGLSSKMTDDEWLPVEVRRGENIIDSLAAAINDSVTDESKQKIVSPAQFVKTASALVSEKYKPVYFLFDQFEELFIFGDKGERLAFAKIIKALSDSHLSMRFLFIMREEYIAGLTELEPHIPGIFDNRMRIEPMTLANARQAIEGPCALYNIRLEKGIADIVLDKLSQGKDLVDLTYLQVYLDNIYRMALQENDGKNLRFNRQLVEKAGCVSDLLGAFLDEQLDRLEDRKTSLAILKSLVTMKGTKRRMEYDAIREHIQHMGIQTDDASILESLQNLIRLRILQEKDRNNNYELRHDALAAKVFEKVSMAEKELLEIRQFLENACHNYQKRGMLLGIDDLNYIAPYESRLHLPDDIRHFVNASRGHYRKSKLRKTTIAFAALAFLVIILSGLSWWAMIEKQAAESNKTMHRASFFNALAKEVENSDPTKALRIAEYAYSLHPSLHIADNIKRIYSQHTLYRNIHLSKNFDEIITAFELSADKNTLFTGHGRGIINTWTAEGHFIRTLEGHQHSNSITSLAVSPCGNYLVSNAMDGMMILWDMEGNMLKTIEQPTFVDRQVRIDHRAQDVFSKAVFSPDGNIIGAIDRHNGQLRLFDHHGNKIKNRRVPGVAFFDFLPDSKTMVSATSNGKVQFWDMSLNETASFMTTSGISAIKACPLGSHVAVAIDERMYLFCYDGNILAEFAGHKGNVFSIDISDDGTYLTTSSADLTSRLWHRSGIMLEILKSHEDLTGSIILEKNSKVMTGSVSGFKLHQTNGKLHTVIELPRKDENFNHFLTFSDDGRHFMYIIEDIAYAFSNEGELISPISKMHGENAVFKPLVRINTSIGCFSVCGNYVFLSFGNDTAGMYDLEGNLLKQFAGHEASSYIGAMAVSPDGSFLVTGARDKNLIIWDMDGNIIKRIQQLSPANALAVSNDSRYIVAGTNDGYICLWSMDGELISRFLRNQREPATHISFSENDEFIRSFGGSSVRISRFFPEPGISHLIKDGGEGDYLLTTHRPDGLIYDNINLKRNYAAHYTFSNDFELIMIGYNSPNAQLLDQSGRVLQHLNGHRKNVEGMAISPDGRTLVVADQEALYLWERKTPYDNFSQNSRYEALSISDKLHYGILDFDDAKKQLYGNDLHMAAMYYFEASEKLDHHDRLNYLDHAFILYKKLIRNDKRADYIYGKLDVIERLQLLTHVENHESEAESLVRELEKHDTAEALKQSAQHFVHSARRLYGFTDLNIRSYSRAMHFYEMLLEKHPEAAAEAELMMVLNSLSLTLVYAGDFAQSLDIALKGFDLNPDDAIVNSRLALAMIFNDMVDEAMTLISDSHDAGHVNTKRQVLAHLNRLQEAGKGHSDHDKLVEVIMLKLAEI